MNTFWKSLKYYERAWLLALFIGVVMTITITAAIVIGKALT